MSISRKILNSIDRLLRLERGTIYKEHGGKIRIVLIYPNIYSIGMSNLGFQGIYGILNSRDDVVCERAFLPNPQDMEEHRRSATPLCSYESKSAIDSFDIAAFSLSFENDYPNIIKILSLCGIPLRASQRNNRHPMLIAGGACCFFNPEPVAELFDFILIGEAEGSLPEFIETYRSFKPSTLSDKRRLKELAVNVSGIYVPEFYQVNNYTQKRGNIRTVLFKGAPETINRAYYKDFAKGHALITSILTTETEFSDLCLLEAMRGCYWKCRFCVVGSIYNPPRIKDKESLKNTILCRAGNSTSVGLIAPSLSDVPYIAEILSAGIARLSITSLRANASSYRLIDMLKDKRSISIAPEAGTERMRKIINKNITEEDILSTSDYILNSGIEMLRLYFMIGLPMEKAKDIEGIINLTKKIRALNSRGKISLTVSVFVPKPLTPFQWHGFADIRETRNKLLFIKQGLQRQRNVKVSHDSPRLAFLQAALARGDREILENIIRVGLDDNPKAIIKNKKIKQRITTPWDIQTYLPWDYINSGADKSYLWQEYLKALNTPHDYPE